MYYKVFYKAQQAATGPDGERGGAVVARTLDYYAVHASWADRAVMGPDRLRAGGLDLAEHPIEHPAEHPAEHPIEHPTGSRTAGLAWLEAERTNLLMVLRAGVDAGLDEPVWQLAGALNALFYNHRHHVDWLEAMRLGVRAAGRRGRHDAEAQLRCAASRAHTDLGNVEQAQVELAAAERAGAASGDPVVQAMVWEFRGRYLEHVEREQAVQAYQRSIALNTQAENPRGFALGHYFLGCCHDRAGRYGDALALLETARAEFRELGDDRMEARCGFSIGLAHLHQGTYAEAGRELATAADAFAAGALWHYEIPAREALAELATRTGDTASARSQLTRALRIEETAGGASLVRIRAALAALN